jgi:hypothetical protein
MSSTGTTFLQRLQAFGVHILKVTYQHITQELNAPRVHLISAEGIFTAE